MPSIPTPTTSGIATTSTGERHIPSSVRADGSVRREIKVRPGYKPPEDVEVYKNRAAESFKRPGPGKGGVPGATFVTSSGEENGGGSQRGGGKGGGSATGKAAKKTKGLSADGAAAGAAAVVAPPPVAEEPEPLDPEAEKEKEAKKLAKKLRQARDLESKKEKGEGLLPEQFEKVIRINELIRQLNQLGFDAEGQRKT